MSTDDYARAGLIARLDEQGAKRVEMDEFFSESLVVWKIEDWAEVSETCIYLEEFMSSAIRNCKKAIEVIGLISESENDREEHLLTALKKYVEDTSEALKAIDDALDKSNTRLDALLFEIPNKSSSDELSWRNLIARRIIIAHRLLTVDNERVYREAKRDFRRLDELISRVYFAPVKTDLANGPGLSPTIKTEVIKALSPYEVGRAPRICETLVIICEDKIRGLLCFRLARGKDSSILLIGPPGVELSVLALGRKG